MQRRDAYDCESQSCLAPAAAWLSRGAAAAFLVPSVPVGDQIGHPHIVLTQTRAKHIEQLVNLQDDLRTETIAPYKQLCATCWCRKM